MKKDFIYDKEGNETRVGDKVWHNEELAEVVDVIIRSGYIGVESRFEEYDLKSEKEFYKYFIDKE